ncbi:MAG: DUF5808 domain-containing protein [Defluviitaleaceae bacterium]|nr:DUF5808 domain-containing protein [Defluviitaleaceae bacterium]
MTILTISLLAAAGFILIGMLISGLIGIRPNGNIILGVSLPNHALGNPAVVAIVKRFTCVYVVNTFLCALLIAPIVFVDESFATFYMLIWCWITIFLLMRLSEKYFSRLYDLKAENEWQAGPVGIVAIDTNVSRLKGTFMVSPRWFFLPLAMCGALLIGEVAGGAATLFWPVMGFGFLLMFYLVYLLVGRVKSKTYSEDSSVNMELNYAFKREWSRGMIVLAVISCGLAAFFPLITEMWGYTAATVITFLFTFASLGAVCIVYSRVRARRNRLLHPLEAQINRDEDQYWIGGILYNNPNDSSIIVEKRIGMGFTMNIGTFEGKLILVGCILFIIAAFVLPFWLI